MNKENIKQLMDNIIDILYKKDNSKLCYQTIKCKKIIHKYSNTKDPLYRILIDDKIINVSIETDIPINEITKKTVIQVMCWCW